MTPEEAAKILSEDNFSYEDALDLIKSCIEDTKPHPIKSQSSPYAFDSNRLLPLQALAESQYPRDFYTRLLSQLASQANPLVQYAIELRHALANQDICNLTLNLRIAFSDSNGRPVQIDDPRFPPLTDRTPERPNDFPIRIASTMRADPLLGYAEHDARNASNTADLTSGSHLSRLVASRLRLSDFRNDDHAYNTL